MAENKFSIAKPTNENYFVWKYRMEMLLIKDLWSMINEEAPNPVTTQWTKKDNEARALISLLISDNQLNHVRKVTSAMQAWNNLKGYHEKASLSNKVCLMRNLCIKAIREW